MAKITFLFTFLWFKFAFFPSYNLLAWMMIAIAVDFATGVAKAMVKKEQRTSTCMRKTIIKFLQYAGALATAMIIGNTAKDNKMESVSTVMQYANDGLLIFIIYIELVSVFENLVEIDSSSMISKYLFKPVHKLLTLSIKNNPISKGAGETTLIVLAILTLSSCARKITTPAPVVTVTTDTTIITKTVVRDSIIHLPGERVIIKEQIPCPDVTFSKEEKKGNASLSVKIDKGVLTADCKTDSLEKVIQGLNSEVATLKNSTVTITKTDFIPVPKPYIPTWIKWLIGVNILYLAARVLIWKYKVPIKL